MARHRKGNWIAAAILTAISFLYLMPILVVAMNSFKSKLFISSDPFGWPSAARGTFAGLSNYTVGVAKIGFFSSFGYSLYITVLSVLVLTLLCSMAGWYIARVQTRAVRFFYYLLVFSMVVPFQMVMFTMSKMANVLRLDNPTGIVAVYAGFGAGLSTFLFTGFAKSIPLEIEEAAFIDGCGPIRTFFGVVFSILRPTAITVAILNAMWIWNDYLLPYLLLGSTYKTIPIAVQYLRGGYGAVDMGAMMAMLVLAILPIIAFYLVCQKYIIKGVISGAVKG
ncbi:MAG: carbohydrate ABC transporter permease [Clostridia bacterium]